MKHVRDHKARCANTRLRNRRALAFQWLFDFTVYCFVLNSVWFGIVQLQYLLCHALNTMAVSLDGSRMYDHNSICSRANNALGLKK